MNTVFYESNVLDSLLINLEIVEIQTEEMVIGGRIGGGKPPVTRFY